MRQTLKKIPFFGNTTDSMIYSNAYYGENDPKTPYISPLYGNYGRVSANALSGRRRRNAFK